jgi:UDP-GlcNAc:undecaprenyl-phosphate GlcNAc-1-phosphate transferase
VTVLVHFLAGLVVGALAWRALRPVLCAPALIRTNIHGRSVATGAGVAVVMAVVVVAAATVVAEAAGWLSQGGAQNSLDLTLRAVLGFGLLGLLDDVVGDAAGGGFRGHVGALAAGRLTTGMVKLGAGVAMALVAVAPLAADRPGWLLVDAAVVAACANLANLLDRAPGRASKAVLVAFAVVVTADGAGVAVAGPAVAVGAGAALVPADLAERCMLGDTGANVLGAAVGLAAVAAFGHGVAVGVLIGVVALTIVSECVSFSRVIEATPPLRWADRLGARRAR